MILDFVVVILTILCTVRGNRNSDFILSEPEEPEPPVCSSYSQLCNLAYNLTEHNQEVSNNQDVCRCPGHQTCDPHSRGDRHTITKSFKLSGHEMSLRMTYCHLDQPARVCRKNEEAIVMRGRGAFVFEIVQDFRCRCYRVLYEHRSWREGAYTYFAYSCGKSKCDTNREPNPACARMRYDGSPGQYRLDYRCRCRRNQECQTSQLPTQTQTTTWKTCQPVAGYQGLYHEDFRRRRETGN